MAKHKGKYKPDAGQSAPSTVTALRQQAELWYRIHVLLYDLSNVGRDPQSESRLTKTTDSLYISGPYFTESEAALIRSSTIEVSCHSPLLKEVVGKETETAAGATRSQPLCPPTTVEASLQSRLAGFLDKRKASGDSRPCGPHDMLPLYTDVFGIQREDIKAEQFLARLRRSGLGERQPSAAKSTLTGQRNTEAKKKKKRTPRAEAYSDT